MVACIRSATYGAQDRLTPFRQASGTRIERLIALRDGKGRHEVAPDITDQPLHLALVVALAGPAEPVVEQVMALQFREHLRSQALSAFHDLGYR
jgi:hypothetical protein